MTGAHGFSRKVLDRAFTIELSDVDLTTWESGVYASNKLAGYEVAPMCDSIGWLR